MPRILGIDTAPENIIATDQIVDGAIVNADINAAAAIAYGKLNLADSIVDADINSAAAIAGSKIVAAAIGVTGVVTGTGTQVFSGNKELRAASNTTTDYPFVIRNLSDTKRAQYGAYGMDTNTGGWTISLGGVPRISVTEEGQVTHVCATASTVVAFSVSATNSNNHGLVVDTVNASVNRDVIRASVGSSTIWRIVGTGQVRFGDGSAAAPIISFEADSDTGIYRVGSGAIGFTTNGTQTANFDAGGLNNVNGSAGAPSYSFIADTNTGMYSAGADQLGFSTGGAQRVLINSSGLTITSGSLEVAGSGTASQFRRTGTSGTGAVFVYKDDSTSTSDNRFIEFRFNGGATAGSIRLNGGNLEVTNTSDRRIKDNIEDLGPSLGRIMALNPRTYTLKSDGGLGVGFVAQEMCEVYPELVTKTDDGISETFKEAWQISTTGLIPHMVKAMQEQQEEIEALKAEVAQLKGAN